MFRNKDCKAATRVGGDEGMGLGLFCDGVELEGSVGCPDVEGLRSGFRLTGGTGGPAGVLEGGCCETAS